VSVGTLAPKAPRQATTAPAARARSLLSNPAAIGVALLTVLAAALRFVDIGHQGFWFDEANTALLVHLSPGKMIGLIPQSESTPPLYYCVAWVWARLFGYGEAPLRALSALAGVAVVPIAYGAGTKLVSQRAGLIVAALTACNPLLIWYSQEARSYELLVMLSAASLLCFAYARGEPTNRAVTAWVIAAALALATHYYALLIVVPEAIWLLFIHRRRPPMLVGVGLVGLCGAALIPLAISQNGTGRSTWIANSPLARRIGQIVPQYVIGFGSPGYLPLKLSAMAIAIGAVVFLLIARSSRRERRGALLAGGLALVGLALNLLLVVGGIDDLLTRNVLALWLPAAVAVAGGLALARPSVVGVAGAAVVCAIGIVATVGIDSDQNLQRPDWRVVATALGHRPTGAGGREILIQHYQNLLPLSLYLPGLRAIRHSGATVSELDVVSISSPPSDGFCWWGSACNLWPSVMQRRYPVRGFRAVGRVRVNQFTVLRMISSRPMRVTPHAVARALTATKYANDELLVQR
jgi:mannosyltransferase